MAKLYSKNQGGFTLIELMVVVLIIGLLAGIAIPRLAKAWDNAKASACQANMKQIEAALELYYFKEGNYPSETEFADKNGETQLEMKTMPTCPQSKDAYIYLEKNLGKEYELKCSNHDFIITEESENFSPTSSDNDDS